MKELGPQDPLRIRFWLDKSHRLYVSVPETPIFLWCQPNGVHYGFTCKQCLHQLTWRSDSKPHLTCTVRQCRGAGALTNLAKFGEEHFAVGVDGSGRPRRARSMPFPLDLLKAYTNQWQVFEQELTLLRVQEEVQESVLRIHEIMDLTSRTHTSRYMSREENQLDLEFRAKVKYFDRTYYPARLGLD